MDTQKALTLMEPQEPKPKANRVKDRHHLEVNGETYRKIEELKMFWETLNGRHTHKMDVVERAVNTEHDRVCSVIRMMKHPKKDE